MSSPLGLASATPSATGTTSTANESGQAGGWQTDFRWLVAWLVLLLVVWAIGKTRVGAVAIYYALVLMLLFLLVTQFSFIAQALAPFSQLGPGLTDGAGPSGG